MSKPRKEKPFYHRRITPFKYNSENRVEGSDLVGFNINLISTPVISLFVSPRISSSYMGPLFPTRSNNASLQTKLLINAGDNIRFKFEGQISANQGINPLYTGNFDTDLLVERGAYSASVTDVDIAKESVRESVLLSDVGEELIGNTFVLVRDVTYKHGAPGAKMVRGMSKAVGAIAKMAADVTLATVEMITGQTIKDQAYQQGMEKMLSYLEAPISNEVLGFVVKTKSHLYQLEWNEDILNAFYENYWCDENTPEDIRRERMEGFEKEEDLFRLNYVGSYLGWSQKIGKRGLCSNGDIIRKVCARSLDNNIAMLQRRHHPFRVYTPILSVDGDNIKVSIGMKEDVDGKSKFEVLEMLQYANGVTAYKRVGVVRPVKNMIWDNRYMAVEEQAVGATLMSTTFRVVSGGNFYPGMLIREIRELLICWR